MVNPVILFRGTTQDVYLIESIYDPNVHTTDGLASGKVVPAIGSIVVDNQSIPNKYVLWVVDAIEPNTLETFYKPGQFVVDAADEPSRLISYGNDTLMLYYDDRGEPTRLIVDSKFVLIGGNAAEYRIKTVINDEAVIISARLDNEGEIVSDRIPVVETGVEGVRKLSDCHTTHNMVPSEFYTLEIFDTTGALTTTARMISKRSTILNDLISSNNPIVEFTAEANQINGSDWVLYVGQNTDDLAIWPKITYANGWSEIVPINNLDTYLYGMGDVNTDVADVQFPLMIKHFLADDIPSTIALGEGVRYLLFETNLRIIPRQYADYSKVSVIPWYDNGASTWKLTFLGYYDSRDRFGVLAPSAVRFVGTAFDGDAEGAQQELVIHADIVNEFGDLETFEQSFAIKVADVASLTPFLIAPNSSSPFVYGAQDAQHNRPKLNYDAVRETYFIPTSLFADEAEFIDDFYTRAVPPYLPETETQAPTPTHFTLRDRTNGRVLVSLPVPINVYDQEMSFIVTGVDPSEYNDTTIIVEFLIDRTGHYDVLYGVPVEVVSGTYNV